VRWGSLQSGLLCTGLNEWKTGRLPGPKRKSIRSRHWSKPMLKDIVFASPLDGHRLRIRYEDGVEVVVDLRTIVSFRGVFAPP